jgi:CoA:oxalate CoA-transferase
MIPSNSYPTKDGRVFISAGVLSQVHRLYAVMGKKELIDSEMGGNQNLRIKHRAEIDNFISAWTKTKTTDEVQAMLKTADVPCTRIPTFDEVCNDPQLLSRDMIIEVEQTISGKVKVPGSLFKLSKTPGNIQYPAPMLGENNQDILSDLLGYSEEKILELSNEGIL